MVPLYLIESKKSSSYIVFQINIDDSSSESYEGENFVENILPPSILQYRRESEEADVDYINLKVKESVHNLLQNKPFFVTQS